MIIYKNKQHNKQHNKPLHIRSGFFYAHTLQSNKKHTKNITKQYTKP